MSWQLDVGQKPAEQRHRRAAALGKGDDPGLGFVERQPSRLQRRGQPCLDLLGLQQSFLQSPPLLFLQSPPRS
jgi:hypothetical protein